MSPFSAAVIHSPYFTFTAAWRATYRQRKAWLGGSHVAASPSPLLSFAGPSTAKRLRGSFAKFLLLSALHCWAPVCQASPRATTWSICTDDDVVTPRRKSILAAVYGSSSCPERTTQPFVPASMTGYFRSRRRTSFRVSQPLWPSGSVLSSVHAGPNASLSYPVSGARPLTVILARTARMLLTGRW